MKNQKIRNNGGFSLVELIVVIAIMAVLIAVLAPTFSRYIDRSRQSNDATTVSTVVGAVQTGVADVTGYDIPAGKVTLTFSSTTGLTVKMDPTSGSSTTYNSSSTLTEANTRTVNGNVAEAIYDTCGRLGDLKMTASGWGADVVVEVTVGSDRKTTVSYKTAKFATYIGKTTN